MNQHWIGRHSPRGGTSENEFLYASAREFITADARDCVGYQIISCARYPLARERTAFFPLGQAQQ